MKLVSFITGHQAADGIGLLAGLYVQDYAFRGIFAAGEAGNEVGKIYSSPKYLRRASLQLSRI